MDIDEKERIKIIEIIHREGHKVGLTDSQKKKEARIEILRLCTGGDVYICRVNGITVTVSWRPGNQNLCRFNNAAESRSESSTKEKNIGKKNKV